MLLYKLNVGIKHKEDLFDALAAEQVDKEALAIYQMERQRFNYWRHDRSW
jgi:hypothetical protein